MSTLFGYLFGLQCADRTLDIAKATVAADRILEMRGKGQEKGSTTPLGRGSADDNEDGVKVEFRDVRFRYPTRDVPVLNGLDLTVSLRFYSNMMSPWLTLGATG